MLVVAESAREAGQACWGDLPDIAHGLQEFRPLDVWPLPHPCIRPEGGCNCAESPSPGWERGEAEGPLWAGQGETLLIES